MIGELDGPQAGPHSRPLSRHLIYMCNRVQNLSLTTDQGCVTDARRSEFIRKSKSAGAGTKDSAKVAYAALIDPRRRAATRSTCITQSPPKTGPLIRQ